MHQYINRISRPLLDRIDLCAETKEIPYKELMGSCEKNETSAEIREAVTKAREIQLERYKKSGICFNSQLDVEGIQKYCAIDSEGQKYLEQIYHKLDLTARSYHRMLKVARTIADLEGAGQIRLEHLSEAACYRMADKKFWTR